MSAITTHWNEAAVHAALDAYGARFSGWAAKVDQIVHFAATNPLAVKVEGNISALFPEAEKIFNALGGADRVLQMAAKVVPGIDIAFELFDIYEAAGGKPMNWGAPLAEQTESERRVQAAFDERQGNG